MTIAKTIKKVLTYLLLLILLIWICGYGAFALHIQTLKPQNQDQKTDAIIVLTGGNLRIDKGLELFAAEMAPQLFISGVHNLVKDDEIKAMWHGDKLLPECCITLGRDATTTTGNAKEAYKWIKDNNIKKIRLVTSSYHMPRAMLEFASALKGSDVEIITHPVEDKENKYNFALIFKEYNKILFRWSWLAMREQG